MYSEDYSEFRVDLSAATAATIKELRRAIRRQRFEEFCYSSGFFLFFEVDYV